MKPTLALTMVAAACCISGAFAQYGAPGHPGGQGPYTGVAPTVPAPSPDSYYGQSIYSPASANYSYYPQQKQATPTNSWSGFKSSGSATNLLSYNYIDGGYRYIDPRGNALDGSHGLGLSVSLGLFNPFFVKAGFNWTSGTGGNTVAAATNADYDFSTISVAGGVFMPITEKLHFLGEVGLIYANLDANALGLSYTDAGIYVRPGLRYQAMPNLELQGGVTVNSTSDYDSRTIDLGAYLSVMPQLDLNLGADFGDE
ncbi:MAG TPA: outer membrane beta-barrel protein, partial [Prosthecobacter sp.]|nr:outer membrane beta-barrel protein [Prosthecobacter sp.]